MREGIGEVVDGGLTIGMAAFALGIGSSHHLEGGRRRLIHLGALTVLACALLAIALMALVSNEAAAVLVVPVLLVGIGSLWLVRFG